MSDLTPQQVQLNRIEGKVDLVEAHLRKLNGKVASHAQTLDGPPGGSGLTADVEKLKDATRVSGTVPTRTMWSAIAALAAVAAVIVALTIGLSA